METRPDVLQVLTLQAPPISKWKRQLSSDSDVQSLIRVSDGFLPTETGACGKCRQFLDISTQTGCKHGYLQLEEAQIRYQHTLPSSLSSSPASSCNFSPKKFKSHLGPVPLSAKGHGAVLSPRRATFSPNTPTCVTTHEPDGVSSDPLLNPGTTMSVHVGSLNSKDIVHCATGERNNSLAQTKVYVPVPRSDYVAADSLANKSEYPRTPTRANAPETQIPDSKKVQFAAPTGRRNREPDIFVFPETGSDGHVIPHQVSRRLHMDQADEPDGLNSPMETDDYPCVEYYRELDQIDQAYQNFDFQHSRRPHLTGSSNGFTMPHRSGNEPSQLQVRKHSSLLGSSLNGRVEARITSQGSRPSLGLRCGFSDGGSGLRDDGLGLRDGGSGLRDGGSDLRDGGSGLRDGGSGLRDGGSGLRDGGSGLRDGGSCLSDGRSVAGSRSENRHFISDSHCSWTFSDKTGSQHALDQADCSRWSGADILDTSESDDLSLYLDEEDDSISPIMLAGWTATRPTTIARQPHENYSRIKTQILGRKSGYNHGDDCHVRTTADTNVCYISLNESGSSMSDDDMEYGLDDNNNDSVKHGRHRPHFHHDFWDETDGRGNKLHRRIDTNNRSAGRLCQSLVTDKTSRNTQEDKTSRNTQEDKTSRNTQEDKTSRNTQENKTSRNTQEDKTSRNTSDNQVLGTDPRQHTKKSHGRAAGRVSTLDNPRRWPLDPAEARSNSVQTMILDADTTNCPSMVTSNQYVCLSDELKFQSCSAVHSSHLSDRPTIRAHQMTTPSELSETVRLCIKRELIHLNNFKDCQNTRQIMGERYDEELANNGDDEEFADEVDGLGDDDNKPSTSLTNSSKRSTSQQEAVENLLQQFDGNHLSGVSSEAQQPGLEYAQGSAPKELARSSQETTEGDLQIKPEQSPSRKKIRTSKSETFESSNEDLELEINSQKGKGGDLYSETVGDQCYKQQEMGYRKMDVIDACHRTLRVNTVLTDSNDSRILRRHSDTSIEDATGNCLSRSRSSPSKLGLTEDSCPDRKQVIFHRPWQDQIMLKSQTYACSQNILDAGTSSAFLKRMTYPTKIASLRLPDLQLVHCDTIYGKSGKPAQIKVTAQACPKSKPDSRGSEQDILKANRNRPSGTTAGSSQSVQHHDAGVSEIRPKRKLEFSQHESWLQASSKDAGTGPSAPRQSKQQWEHLHVSGTREPDGEGMNLSPGNDRNRGRPVVRALDFQNGVPSSCPVSSQQGASHRRHDEVDIRVQVLDVLQEHTQLRQRLDRIYQSDDSSCECSRIEQNILNVALDMFRALGTEASCRENWFDELQRTNQMVRSALDLADNCRRLCRHGRQVTDVLSGSVIIRMRCPTLASLVDLCDLHASGDLHVILLNIVVQHVTFGKLGLTLSVTLDTKSVQTCQEYFLTRMDKPLRSRSAYEMSSSKKMVTPRTVIRRTDVLDWSSCPTSPHRVVKTPYSRCVPGVSSLVPAGLLTSHRERKFSFGEINRTAFQELNISDVGLPSSPSFLWLRDETFQTPPRQLNSPNILTSPKLLMSPASSPLTSPRKLKLCDVISEQENMGQENG